MSSSAGVSPSTTAMSTAAVSAAAVTATTRISQGAAACSGENECD
jgi:hypothetical protein